MDKLMTPFGEISVLLDGVSVPYTAQKGSVNAVLWPDVHDRYQIQILFIPDGKEHTLSCVFSPDCACRKEPYGGEWMEGQSFHNEQGIEMSIGIAYEGEGYYADGERIPGECDYDMVFLPNGMAYLILAETKTDQYGFGVAWIDNPRWEDYTEEATDRSIQTEYAADPLFSLEDWTDIEG